MTASVANAEVMPSLLNQWRDDPNGWTVSPEVFNAETSEHGIIPARLSENQNFPAPQKQKGDDHETILETNRGGARTGVDPFDGETLGDCSAAIKIPSPSPAFDLGVEKVNLPLVANDDLPPVANSSQTTEDKGLALDKKTASSVAVEVVKVSTGCWLVRVRFNSKPGRPTIPVSYINDETMKNLRRRKKRYEQFKKSIKTQYQDQEARTESDHVRTDTSST